MLRSGQELEADILVTATGLDVQALGGMKISVNGNPYAPGRHILYKGVLYKGVLMEDQGNRLKIRVTNGRRAESVVIL